MQTIIFNSNLTINQQAHAVITIDTKSKYVAIYNSDKAGENQSKVFQSIEGSRETKRFTLQAKGGE